MLWKKIILKDNISEYIESKHKNTGTSSCKSIHMSELQCLNSSIYTLLELFGLSLKYEVDFPGKFVLIEYVTKFSPAS